MTFKIKSNPTIDACITIVGQGREQQLNVTYRHKTGKEYDALMKQLAAGEITTADLLLLLIEKWDADLFDPSSPMLSAIADTLGLAAADLRALFLFAATLRA